MECRRALSMPMRTVILMLFAVYLTTASAATLTGRTVRVTDGDTIVILGEGNIQHKTRLQGIDAPEQGQPFGSKSKKHLAAMVAGKDVTVEYNEFDRYGRIVGTVFLNGKDICLEQVSAGLAWHYKKYQGKQSASDRKLYGDAEILAKEDMRGLWSEPFPTPPWDWRHGSRNWVIGLPSKPTVDAFQCESKKFCREMTSCKEAKFYLRNCGTSGLDGDGDGTPCEWLCR
jgi:endonuclease YncB( thermonuclease family)